VVFEKGVFLLNGPVGYIGLGKMGKALAKNALGAGFEVHVYDIRQEPITELRGLGARAAANPKEIASHCQLIGVVVWDDAQVRQVMTGDDGLLAGAKAGSVIVIHTTIHPATVQKLATEVRNRGLEIVDAQMSGGQAGAENRQLCFMVGGKREAFEQCRPLLASSASSIFHTGELGTGAVMKLVQQTILCLNRLSAYEGMRLARAYGLDERLTQHVLGQSFAQSYVADNWLNRFVVKDEDPQSKQGFALVLQTITPALDLARELGVGLPVAALAQQMFPLLKDNASSGGD
jgi:3-hydroxyisobutyrate dehydrogenase-like beta-hydroxyacid dehydrogenase